jgi:hypothetical protein
VSRTLLVGHRDVGKRRVVQPVVDGHDRPALDAEDVGDASAFERACYRSRPVLDRFRSGLFARVGSLARFGPGGRFGRRVGCRLGAGVRGAVRLGFGFDLGLGGRSCACLGRRSAVGFGCGLRVGLGRRPLAAIGPGFEVGCRIAFGLGGRSVRSLAHWNHPR